MQKADIIIIGGGAAGLMAAAGAARILTGRSSSRVLILEKMHRPGRKIMITGKGRCNFTNVKPWNEFSGHIHPKPNFLKPAFHNLNPQDTIDFLQKHGLDTVVERGDRAFPASHRSSEVTDALVRAAEKAGAQIVCNKEVTEIRQLSHIDCTERNDDGQLFSVQCSDGDIYTCKRLIICTGGLSYPKTGSTGDGYRWAGEFGHSIRPVFPSLTAIVPKGYKTGDAHGHIDRSTPLSDTGKALMGIQLKNTGLSIIIDGNVAQEEFGDLDFTDGGLEGPIGFKVSRKCVNAIINGSKVTAVIDLKPAVETEALHSRIGRLWQEICDDKRNTGRTGKDRLRILLLKLIPAQLIPTFIKYHPALDRNNLAKALKNWKLDIAGYVGYERCVITAGGVSLDEIASKTLESRLISGLYFAGEILDLDADTGGYNLQTAFSTGCLAGISAAGSLS